MSKGPKLMNYVSGMDQFLQEFDKQHPNLSKSQLQEVLKYQRIYKLRDTAERPETEKKLWDNF